MPKANITDFTNEQHDAFQKAASLGSGVQVTDNGNNYVAGGNNPVYLSKPAEGFSAISADTLAPTAPVNYQTPTPTSPYPVAGLGQDLFAPTAPEQKAQTANEQLQGLNTQLIGESAYRAEQEQAQGIQALTQTQNDLTSRLTALKNEALAIPIQAEENAVGKQSLYGQQTVTNSALRTNAIKALSVNSLLEASRGNLTTALDMVDRAVAQKYDPIREEITAKKANLDLILNSPDYSREEKKRAQAQKDVQDEKARKLDIEEQSMRDIQDVALAAAKNGASGVILQAIQAAKDPLEAIEIAAQYGALAPAEKPNLQTVKLDSGETVVIDMNTGQTVRSLGAGGGGVGGGVGGGGGGGVSQTTPLSGQPGYSNLTAKQKNQADSLNNLVRTLKDYKDYYNQNPGAFGGFAGNLFGGDSGLIQTKVNSIIFAAAQAEGTGALQQADREVIERIIPNPSSIAGAFNTLTKGGKAGNIAKLDDQIQKYTENLGTYGLTPMADPSPNRSATLRSPDGQTFDASDLTAEEYAQAVEDGYIAE